MSEFIRGEREQSEPNDKIKLRPSIISQDILFAPKKQWLGFTKSFHLLGCNQVRLAKKTWKRIILEISPFGGLER